MNGTQLRGHIKRFKGEARRQWGRLTGSTVTRMGGTMQKFAGSVQVRYGRMKETVGL